MKRALAYAIIGGAITLGVALLLFLLGLIVKGVIDGNKGAQALAFILGAATFGVFTSQAIAWAMEELGL